MAFPLRPDAPELPDFSMLKRLARDQLIYLLEQVSARHACSLYRINSLALTGCIFIVLGPWYCLGASVAG